jgi:hypothetical protein
MLPKSPNAAREPSCRQQAAIRRSSSSAPPLLSHAVLLPVPSPQNHRHRALQSRRRRITVLNQSCRQQGRKEIRKLLGNKRRRNVQKETEE